MSIREKIGQRLFVGFEGQTVTDTLRELVTEYKTGNIILFKQNIENKHQLKKLCDDIQQLVQSELSIPAFISIDQEGGMVTRLSGDCSNVPGAMAIAATGDKDYAYQAGLITAKELLALGVNFDLAPSLDVNNNPNNPVIGVRSYGDSAKQVSDYGIEMIRGLTDGGILSCIKHFPGHGNTNVDSHLGLPTIDFTYQEIEKLELVPFKNAIQAGAQSVMMAHISYPKIESDGIPATFSKVFIQDILRDKMAFDGLIISDCMEMQAIQINYGTPNGIVRAVGAGVDIAFCSHTAELAKQSILAIEQAVEQNVITEKSLDQHIERILDFKQRYIKPNDKQSLDIVGQKQHKDKINEILEKSFCLYGDVESFEMGNNPVFISCVPYNATGATTLDQNALSFAKHLCKKFGGTYIQNSSNPTKDEIERIFAKTKGATSIVFGSYQAHLNSGQTELANAIAQKKLPMLCVALRNPYDLIEMPKLAMKVAVFEYTEQSLIALEKIVSSEKKPSGNMPITL